jgi:hypothetical protein
MGLKGDLARLKRLGRDLAEMGQPGSSPQMMLLEPVKQQGLVLLRYEFTESVDPSGSSWAETVRGKPALVSKKLPFAFDARIDRGIVRFIGKSKRDLLTAHDQGFVFPKRSVAANKQYLNFNSKGKLVAERRIFKKDGTPRRGAYQRFAKAHHIRERRLVQRQIAPSGPTMPSLWDAATRSGLAIGFGQWAEKVSR